MKSITTTIFRGVAVILPVVITAYAIHWLAVTAERSLGDALRSILPEGVYFTGLGIILGLALVFAIGLLAEFWIFRRLGAVFEAIVERVPLVKTLYGSVRDLMGFFSGSQEKEMKRVVSVAIPGLEISMIGFVTRDEFDDVKGDIAGGEDRVAVYLPMSYQIGGFTIMVARSALTELDMTVEECMRFAMTAGVTEKA